MSDTSQGPGWWIASDGKWYSPELAPAPPPPSPTATPFQVAPGLDPTTGLLPSSQKQARADVKAQKARDKALRPWYKLKRTWILGAIALLVIILIAANAGSSSNSAPTATPGTTPATAGSAAAAPTTTAAPANPGTGQPALDGDFSFTVQSFVCGGSANAAVEGSDGFGETIPAGAQECVATMAVTADKTTAQSFFASNQYAFDAAGTKYNADTTGAIYIPNSNPFVQVNPGITVTAIVPFQVPTTTKITTLQLHDSAFSGGVIVNVG